MLILVGSGVIVFEAVRRLIVGTQVEHARLRHRRARRLDRRQLRRVARSAAARARETESAALEGDAAHLRTDAATSVGVLVGLVLVQHHRRRLARPGRRAAGRGARSCVAGVRILTRSSRVLVDEALPASELDAIRAEIRAFGPQGVAGFHKLRARRAGARRYVDLHVQFSPGTTLEHAHETAHALQDAIATRIAAPTC